MKFFKITVFSFFALAACGSLRAQDLRGVVRDAENQPLVGASVYWAGTTIGASTDAQGAFLLHRVKGYDKLVASYLGFVNDTLDVKNGVDKVAFALRSEGVALEGVVVEGNLSGNFVKRDGIVKGEMISFAGLCKMACCNLAESFENSASVTVGYSDAISGARQIKMLGLAGTYTQILDENRPIMRGLSAPYGLSYTPGMWLNSIQVSKGVASVTAGHEAITGQINLEHRKPTDDERLFVNLYLDDELRPEANVSTAFPVTKDKKLSSVILLHGSMDTDARKMDHNHDGFRDLPKSDQINVANKWLYAADNGTQVRWGWKFVQENRLGGMLDYKNTRTMREAMEKDWDWRAGDKKMPLYGSHIRNRNANGYFKVGMPVGPAVYDPDEQDEMRSNLAFVADFDHFSEDAYFGLNDYTGNQNSLALNLMYNHYFTYRSSLIVGVQGHLDYYREKLLNPTPWIAANSVRNYDFDRNEREAGAYAEYTYAIKDKFSVVAGLRGDYNHYYDRFFLTPRGHLKWNITPSMTLRASGGLGYRSTNVITDNIGVLATGREIRLADFRNGRLEYVDLNGLDRMEKALTVGGSLTQTFGLVNPGDATLSFDYFRTQFYNSVVADQEMYADRIVFYDTDGRSYTDTYQIDFSWSPVERLDIFATFRYTDSEMTIRRADGGTARVASAGEPVQDAAQHSVCHEVPPLGVRRHGAAQRSGTHPDADGRPRRQLLFAPLSDVLRAGEPQGGQVRHLRRVREYRRLPPEGPDSQCAGPLRLQVQLDERLGTAHGPQVLCRFTV